MWTRSGDFAWRLFVSRTRESIARCFSRTQSNAKRTQPTIRPGALNHRINIAGTFSLFFLNVCMRVTMQRNVSWLTNAFPRDNATRRRSIPVSSSLLFSPRFSSLLATCRRHAYRRKEKSLADVAGNIQIRVISGYRFEAFHRPVFKFLTTCRRGLL